MLMASQAEDVTPPARAEGVNKSKLHMSSLSLRANSSEYGDVLEEGGEEVTSDRTDYDLPAEEKNELDMTAADPQSTEVGNSDNISKSHEGHSDSHEASESFQPTAAAAAGGSSSITFKFSYEPKEFEQQYYDQLFYHVATASSNLSTNTPKEGIIVSPKEAAKFFYTSSVPPERLRMIWNMATLPSTPLPRGVKPPPSMTWGQFRVAVRLIQLFQNRVAAKDEQLTVSGEDDHEGGGRSEGGWDKLAPAYFNGISGEIIPLPTNLAEERKKAEKLSTSKINGVHKSKANDAKEVERRRSSRTISSISSNEGKNPSYERKNGHVSNNDDTNTKRPGMSMAEMEKEIKRLTKMVKSLQREVKELKRGNAQNNIEEDEDPTMDVEIYWGEKKVEQLTEKEIVTPNEVPLKSKVHSKRNSMPVPVPTSSSKKSAATDLRRNSAPSKRLTQVSQNIPAVHPSIPRRSKGHLGLSNLGPAAANSQVPRQSKQIPEEGESLTSQMHAVRRQEEFGNLLSRAKDRMDGDGGSNSGSKQSNHSGTFRPAPLRSMSRRSVESRPNDLRASTRHIVRDANGNIEAYSKEEIEPPSTMAVDLTPLNPRPLIPSFDINEEIAPKPAKHRRSLTRRKH